MPLSKPPATTTTTAMSTVISASASYGLFLYDCRTGQRLIDVTTSLSQGGKAK